MVRLAWIVFAVALWTAAAVAARAGVGSPVVNTIYACALAATYLAAWALAGAWAGDRRRTFAAVAVTLALVLGVGVLELGAATRRLDYHRLREALIGIEGPNVDFVDDPVLLFRRASHAKWSGWPRTDMSTYFNLPFRTDHPITFTTDSHGFRNPSDLTRADVALVGDSYVEGWGVSDDETVSARLAAKLQRPVANLGTAGYGSLQELQVVERDALPLAPHLVAWFFFEGNDLDDDQNFENAMAYRPAAGQPPPVEPLARRWRDFEDRSFTWNVFQQLRQMTDRLVPNRIATYGWFRDANGTRHQMYFYDFYATRPITDFERARLQVTAATLRQARDDCRRRGAEFVVYYVPIKFRVYRESVTFPPGSPCEKWTPWDLETDLRALCQRDGIRFVSLTGPMRQAAHRGMLLYQPADSHWNAAGAAFVADLVATDAHE
ncbi:MAG TPA: SGNH/GDSL hydrolase family protein [Vicinamibacterales bacterium]|nr:SGNH/GDSL hydrolase family protein [Vicinamibacterales bacterium]